MTISKDFPLATLPCTIFFVDEYWLVGPDPEKNAGWITILRKNQTQIIAKLSPSQSNSISIDWTEMALTLIITTHPHPPTHGKVRREGPRSLETLQAIINDKVYVIQSNLDINPTIFWGGGSTSIFVNPKGSISFNHPR